MKVAEMKMLKRSFGMISLDKIMNEFIRGSQGVAGIVEKMEENMLRYYGRVERRKYDKMVNNTVWVIEVIRGRYEGTWC